MLLNKWKNDIFISKLQYARFLDYSWIKDFEANFPQSQPRNPELGRFLWLQFKDNWPFKLVIADTDRLNLSF